MNINIVLYLAAYLIAGIPFGYLLAKKFAGVDIKMKVPETLVPPMSYALSKKKTPNLQKNLEEPHFFWMPLKGFWLFWSPKCSVLPNLYNGPLLYLQL